MECEGQDRTGFHWAAATGHGSLARLLAILRLWRDRSRGRRSLMTLSDRSLRDLGISRSEARAEFDEPFWRREHWERRGR